MDDSEVDYPIIEPDEKKMDHLVSGIQKKFGLELLGIDVIIENGTGRYGVIDINAFPGTMTLLCSLPSFQSCHYTTWCSLLIIEERSIEVHNSRRPLSRLTLTLTFDLIFIGGQSIIMDYPCAKFGDFSF